MKYLIDTDWIVDVLNNQERETQVLDTLAAEGLALSIITYGELYEGAHYARDPQAALRGLEAFLEGKVILPLTSAIMQRFAILRGGLSKQLRQQVGDMDLLIAATALVHDLTVVTNNLKDFRRIPDLKLYRSI